MHTKTIPNIVFTALIILGLLLAALPTPAAAAPAAQASELIAAVNAYRAQYGLAPYEIDGGLMALAQSHSDYQASIRKCTHARADGTGPGDYGISAENIACGRGLNPDIAIYYQWKDDLHTATLLGPTTGLVGAGVAAVGDMIYYTLAVKRLSGNFDTIPQQPANPANPAAAPDSASNAPVSSASFQDQFFTSTPNADGSIAHIVQYGETLVGIAEAYGVPLNDLIGMNKLDPAKPVIYERQVLIIRLAFTATPFMTATYTPRPPTRTPMPSRTPRPTRTPTQPRTPEPTATATSEPLINVPSLDSLGPLRPLLAYAFIGISAVGLVVLLITSFLPGRRE